MSSLTNRGESYSLINTREGDYQLSPYPDCFSRCKDPSNSGLSSGSPPVRIKIHNCSGIDRIFPDDTANSKYFNESQPVPGIICCYNLNRDLYICNISPQFGFLDKRTFKSPSTFHELKTISRVNLNIYLLVGLTNGEIHVSCLSKKGLNRIFNEEKNVDKTPVTCVKWLPNSDSEFLCSHASGCLYKYSDLAATPSQTHQFVETSHGPGFQCFVSKTGAKNPSHKWIFGNRLEQPSSHHTPIGSILLKNGTSTLNNVFSSKLQNTSRNSEDTHNANNDFNHSNSNQGLNMLSNLSYDHPNASCINQFEFSPSGDLLAIVTQDGYLRVFEFPSFKLYGFMRSFFGGLSCLDWSPDGKYIAVGSQDDLITLWSVNERVAICRCQGHRSWVTAVRFDPELCTKSDLNVKPEGLQQLQRPPMRKSLSTSEPTNGSLYRLGSVAQDTYLCLWEITEDVIRQGLRFAGSMQKEAILQNALTDMQNHPLSAQHMDMSFDEALLRMPSSYNAEIISTASCSMNNSPVTLSLECQENPNSSCQVSTTSVGPVNGVDSAKGRSGGMQFSCMGDRNPFSRAIGRISTLDRSSNGKKANKTDKFDRRGSTKAYENKISMNMSLPCEISKMSAPDSSFSEPSLMQQLINTLAIQKRDEFLLGTVACPFLKDIPVLEPIDQTRIPQDRFTDLVFRPDGIHTSTQFGLILLWKRPVGITSSLEQGNPALEEETRDENYRNSMRFKR
ncbi:WD repeat-containing protein 20 [Cichlidogyrus casuarinus]|uniref:WD repeat-containing protein 20 n=1 Tax=Cichlidogyrus casuarinus TaxID=1844966 RepID=A0ABD2QJE7_9PLAT